ncbi:MAG: hypothetical protein ACREAA_14955 [Candidatus Polarisedimenticolia bacterium]
MRRGVDEGTGILEPLERRAWLLALFLCLPALVPALRPGWFEGHDDLHILRLIEYDAALSDGQIPPRWFPDVSAGLGNPHPLYYAPLFYVAALAFKAMGLGVVGGLKGAIVLFTLLAALGMYRFARLFWSAPAAVVAAAAYTYTPYHLLDLYVRKAFSEVTVFAILPFLLEALYRIRTRGTRWDIVAAALWLAALFSAHTISTMMAPPLLAAYALLLCRLPDAGAGPRRAGAPGRWSWRWLGGAAVAGCLGTLLAAFFLVPAFLEREAINLKMYTEAYVDYHQHFVMPRQLVWWPWGFGMSRAGLRDAMSFRLGLAQIAGMLLAAAGLGRLSAAGSRLHALFFLGLAAAAMFMMLPLSVPVWDAFASFKFVQFPWRFLTLTTVSSGVLCAAAFAAWAPQGARRARGRAWAAAGVVCAVMAGGAVAGGTLGVNQRIAGDRIEYQEKPYINLVEHEAGTPAEPLDRAMVRRHTLNWIDHLPPGVSYLGLTQADAERPAAEVVSGAARITDLSSGSSWHRFRVETDGTARLRVNAYRFPGWTVRVDGQVVDLRPGPPRERPVLFFDVPPGSHAVEAALEPTTPRRLGDGLTLAGLAGIALVSLWPSRKSA